MVFETCLFGLVKGWPETSMWSQESGTLPRTSSILSEPLHLGIANIKEKSFHKTLKYIVYQSGIVTVRSCLVNQVVQDF